MKFETNRTKQQSRVAHQERMKRLDKAKARAEQAYKERYPEREEQRKAHEKRVKELEKETERAMEAEDDRYWNEESKRFNDRPPLYNKGFFEELFGSGGALGSFTQSRAFLWSAIVGVTGLFVTAAYYAWVAMAWYEAPAYMAFGWGLEKLRQKLKKK